MDATPGLLGLNPSSRRLLNNAVAGPLMKKTPEEIVTLLNELFEDAEQWSTDQGDRKRSAGVHQQNPRAPVQGPHGFQTQQRKSYQSPQPNNLGLEDLIKAFINKSDEKLETQGTAIREQGTAIRNLEKQIGQLATLLSERAPRTLPENVSNKDVDKQKVNVAVEESKHMPLLHFPQKIKREKLDKFFGKFLGMLKQLFVNIPFTEVLTQMPAYAKFLKEILSSKRKLEKTKVVKLNAHCSAILQNKIPKKCGDSGSFTIPCSLGSKNFDKALCDSGASINLMPLSVFKKL
uniref:Uncharacterized protein n=1 Tax=Nicotiana tabacum TaxID=4097 RepID=A0A1S3ZHR6_TOBAC|nr:PREDICTED: uncharacterized protein LOC107786811 [Nicotiana tabacum]